MTIVILLHLSLFFSFFFMIEQSNVFLRFYLCFGLDRETVFCAKPRVMSKPKDCYQVKSAHGKTHPSLLLFVYLMSLACVDIPSNLIFSGSVCPDFGSRGRGSCKDACLV